MKREPGMAYNTKTLNKIFAVIAVIFFITVLWMFLDDFIRPWKAVQIKSLDVEREVLSAKIAAEEKGIDGDQYRGLQEKIKRAQNEVESHNDDIEKIEDELALVDKDIYTQTMTNGTNGSLSGEYQFKFEHYHVDGKKKLADKYEKKMKHHKALFAQGKDDLKSFQLKQKNLLKKIKGITKKRDELKKELDGLVGAKGRLLASMSQTEKNPIWFFRNSPFVDFLDPTLKIKQVVLDNLSDDRYFVQTKKVDRCTTCHVFIDKPGFEEKENPYRTHPRLTELAVGQNSAHPIKKFGCTGCHGGEGHRVNDFNAPVHMPQSDEQEKEWVEKYHWHEPHKVPQPILPLKYTQGMCIKCHQGVERLQFADDLNHGKQLMKNYGCYGCHKIEGWEHMTKPGPSLEKITAKTSKEFMKNWIWSPHVFNKHSRMPSFFGQSNNSKPEFMKKNMAEVNAMVEFLAGKSKPHSNFAVYKEGSVDKGKELIQKIGCIGCHQVEGIDEPYNKVKSMSGPYLTGTGSKVDADWLVSWLIKPSHYQSDTIMPSFRLSKSEANDIATYLLSLKNKKFESLRFAELNKKIRDEILVEDLSKFEPIAEAKIKLEKMSDIERTMRLGEISIGKYGCYSCHTIAGFDPARPPIGPELTKVGSKPIHQFGYGQQHDVAHRRDAWFRAHLENPRRWDIGVPKPFKDLNRMPNFYLSNKEIEAMTTVLVGQVSDYVPMKGKKNLNAIEKIAEDGKKITNKYNCYGCHKIDGLGGDIAAAFEDDLNAGPPWLVDQGHRVHSDWFYNFLQNVTPIRPYMEVRMPSFNFQDGELNTLMSYFSMESKQANFYKMPKVVWEKGERVAAQKIWDELACVSCHSSGFNQDEPQAPDLRKAYSRLRASWIKKWLSNPAAIQPYTPMPDFWEGGKTSAVEGVLGDDAQKQINAMVKYVLELGEPKKGSTKAKVSKEVKKEESTENL